MDKEQQKLLAKAWELSNKILREIRALARMNPALAYGCIRSAETVIDVMFVDALRNRAAEVINETVPMPGTEKE